ncbi:diguanylate cyclase [Clostridium sp.]|jgi:diguanylate cyclase (GGDEF)-like protein/PAS domain S-box-containing protein|uniref:sensor domain-containing diguanylate cyclase n=1 Tax=Clostridium sp. TaxID=1506 RepID=UPI003EE91D54
MLDLCLLWWYYIYKNSYFVIKKVIKGGIYICRGKATIECKNTELLLQENYKFLQTLIDTIPNPIFYKDENGIYKHCNLAFAEYLGLKREEIIDHNVYDISPKELADVYYKADMKLMESKLKQIYETQVHHADGTIHDVLFTKGAVLNKEGQVVGIAGNMTDITRLKKIENNITRDLKLKELMLEINHAILEVNDIKELFILVLEKLTVAMDNRELGCVLVLDQEENLNVIASNGYDNIESEKISSKLKDSFFWNAAQGKLDKSIIINDIQKLNFQKYTKLLETTDGIKVESSISIPILLDKKLYGLINIDSTINNDFNESDLEILEYLKNQIEIGIAKHKLYEETVYLSRYDKLTNVYNRRYFEELFEVVIARSKRYNESFFVVVFDLNGLKIINDTYGHLAGDQFIKTFASDLSSKIRISDIFARFGGDKFVAVFLETNLQNLKEKLETIAKEFCGNPIIFEENTFVCRFSYGISNFPENGIDYNELIRIADKNMYEYKQKLKKSL